MKVTFEMQVKLVIILLSVALALNTFCSRQIIPQPEPVISTETEARNITTDEIIRTAQKYLGVPHCMGGKSTRCIDCSGLLVKVFASHGIYLPHNSEEQSKYGRKITGMNELKRGDLVFFIKSYKTSRYITHSGIYIGNNQFIHTSSSKGVTITSMSNPWWNDRFIFGTRIFD